MQLKINISVQYFQHLFDFMKCHGIVVNERYLEYILNIKVSGSLCCADQLHYNKVNCSNHSFPRRDLEML